MTFQTLKKTIWNYYKTHGRHDLPWRKTKDPYKILVSEIMLQQTQVSRVIVKYKSFIKKFPTVQALADASLRDVLSAWQGLGYNRRGMYLKKCAEKVVTDFEAKTFNFMKLNVRPSSPQATIRENFNYLCSLPGIGPATAGDILAFAYNIPATVIETNIRSVFIHFFFKNKFNDKGHPCNIHDRDILPLIEKTLDQKNPREWYWALFDYGAYLKSTQTNPSRKSAHHTKQSTFAGSNRQKRAQILKLLLEKPSTEAEITKTLSIEPSVVATNLTSFMREGVLVKRKTKFYIS